jgi:predicted HAD superfamily phosphohydrolase
MTTQTIPVQVPRSLYHQLERLATLTNQPLEDIVERSLAASIPPLPDTLSDEIRDDLLVLEGLEDDELWEAARSVISPEQQEEISLLLEKNKATLTEAEKARLSELQAQADRLMLRKAYAYVLLKWRGHRLPTLAEWEGV